MSDQLSAVMGVRASTSLMTVLQLPMNERRTHFRLQVGIKKRPIEAICHLRSTHAPPTLHPQTSLSSDDAPPWLS